MTPFQPQLFYDSMTPGARNLELNPVSSSSSFLSLFSLQALSLLHLKPFGDFISASIQPHTPQLEGKAAAAALLCVEEPRLAQP